MAKKNVIQSLEQASGDLLVAYAVITGAALETHIYNADVPERVRVLDCHFIATQAPTGACTGRLDDGTLNITDAMDLNVGGDRDVFRAAEIDDAGYQLDPADTLDFTLSNAAGRVAGIVVVYMVRERP